MKRRSVWRLASTLSTMLCASAVGAPVAAAAARGGMGVVGDPDEAPPSATGLLVAAVLLVIVISAVLAAMRIARRRRSRNHVPQRHRYGVETADLVGQISAAWMEHDEEKLSRFVSEELMGQWRSRFASVPGGDEEPVHVDRVQTRFVARELPDPDEEDRVVMHVRAHCFPSA